MLRHQRTLGLVVVIAAVFSGGLAHAQPGGGGRGGRGGPGFGPPGMGRGPGMGGVMMLAGNPVVQKEIGLEGEAAAKVQKLVTSFREEMQSAMEEAGLGFGGGPGGGGPGGGGPGQGQGPSPEEREKRAGITKKLNDKFMPQLKETLSAPQAERLQQINWQIAGSGALAGPELGKSLELTQEQQDKIKGINQDYMQKQNELRRGAGGGGGRGVGAPDFQAVFTKVQELNKERDSKAIEVLSKDQQEKYTKLLGKSFDVAQLQMGPGGRGGFGGRGGPGGPSGAGGPGGRPRGAAGRPQNKDDKKE
jgi:hypothetical protein